MRCTLQKCTCTNLFEFVGQGFPVSEFCRMRAGSRWYQNHCNYQRETTPSPLIFSTCPAELCGNQKRGRALQVHHPCACRQELRRRCSGTTNNNELCNWCKTWPHIHLHWMRECTLSTCITITWVLKRHVAIRTWAPVQFIQALQRWCNHVNCLGLSCLFLKCQSLQHVLLGTCFQVRLIEWNRYSAK